MDTVNDLAVLLGGPSPDAARIEYGTVTQASPLFATVGTSTVAVSLQKLASYTPTLGDKVLVITQGPDRVVLGKTN